VTRFNSTLVRFKPEDVRNVAACVGVSIPLWFDSNSLSVCLRSSFPPVSIPLWFDSNSCEKIPYQKISSFQFHSGSIQTVAVLLSAADAPLFQFHSGSIQTCWSYWCKCTRSLFQFHSGSIQTWVLYRLPNVAQAVSIPLWFDSNEIALPASTFNDLAFQFHSGSIQTV